MKSITKKLSCWLATLLLGLFSISAMAQTPVQATQAEVNAMIASPGAQTLSSYLTASGYTNGGVVANSAKAVEITGIQPGTTSTIKSRTAVVIVVFRKTGADPVYQSLASEKREVVGATGSTPTLSFHAVGENTTTNFYVSGSTVKEVAKSATTAAIFDNGGGKGNFNDCWLDAISGTGDNCSGCYNCLKSCLTGSGLFGNKLLCCLTKCAIKCGLCVLSIFKLYSCYTAE
jgi:hypothetical protein